MGRCGFESNPISSSREQGERFGLLRNKGKGKVRKFRAAAIPLASCLVPPCLRKSREVKMERGRREKSSKEMRDVVSTIMIRKGKKIRIHRRKVPVHLLCPIVALHSSHRSLYRRLRLVEAGTLPASLFFPARFHNVLDIRTTQVAS